MINLPTTTKNVTMRLVIADADAVPLPAEMRFSNKDPLRVSAVFTGDGMEVEWQFGRELLRNGISAPFGDGDVHIWPSWGTGKELVMISLTSPDGQAVLETSMDDMKTFLAKTDEDLPLEDEEKVVVAQLDYYLERILNDDDF